MEMNNKVSQYPDYFYAGFWIRFFAYIVDLLMIGSIVRLINGPLSIFTKGVNEITIWHLSIGAAAIIYPLYFVLFTKFTGGQTLGKIIFGIRVVSFTEHEMTWKTVIIRELFGRYIQKTLLFLYLIVAVTPKKQHIADMLTDTGVISENHLEAFRYGMKLSSALSDEIRPPHVPQPPQLPQAQADTAQTPQAQADASQQELPQPQQPTETSTVAYRYVDSQ